MLEGERKTLVIDNGTFSVKAGFAGTKDPHFTVPTIVGTAKDDADMVGIKNKAFFVGNEAIAKTNLLNMVNPIENGVITNWEFMTELWDELINNMFHCSLKGTCILTGAKPNTPKSNMYKQAQIFFEHFDADSFYCAQQSVLSLFSAGLLTGLVLDDGEGIANITPVYEGYTIPHAIHQTELCGTFLTDNLRNLLLKKDPSIESFQTSEIIALKEKLCYVPIDFQAEEQSPETFEQARTPTGRYYQIGKERFLCTEALFDPLIIDKEVEGIHQVMFDSIMKCDIDIRKDLYKSIFLSGGTTMIPGLSERIEKEVIALAPPSMKIRVLAPPQRRNAVWIGGSVLGAQEFFHTNMAVTKAEYLEQGEHVIVKKCHN